MKYFKLKGQIIELPKAELFGSFFFRCRYHLVIRPSFNPFLPKLFSFPNDTYIGNITSTKVQSLVTLAALLNWTQNDCPKKEKIFNDFFIVKCTKIFLRNG